MTYPISTLELRIKEHHEHLYQEALVEQQIASKNWLVQLFERINRR